MGFEKRSSKIPRVLMKNHSRERGRPLSGKYGSSEQSTISKDRRGGRWLRRPLDWIAFPLLSCCRSSDERERKGENPMHRPHHLKEQEISLASHSHLLRCHRCVDHQGKRVSVSPTPSLASSYSCIPRCKTHRYRVANLPLKGT